MTPLVDTLIGELATLGEAPFAIYGHGMGALVGFELARRLAALGRPGPDLLVVGAQREPAAAARRDVRVDVSDAEFLRELRALGGVAEAALADAALMDLMLPTLRADFELLATYVPSIGPVLDCPITVLAGSADPHVPREDLEGWRT